MRGWAILSLLALAACAGPRIEAGVQGTTVEPLPPPREPLAATPEQAFRAEAPVVSDADRPPLPRVSRTVLDNGLELLQLPQPDPRVVLLLVSRAAHEDLPLDRAGLSTFTAEAIPRTTMVGGRAIPFFLERQGIATNVHTGADEVGVGVTAGRDDWEEALRGLATVVRNPAFDARSVGQIQQARATRIERSTVNGQSASLLVSRRLLFAEGERWGYPLWGPLRAVAGVTPDLVRQHWQATFRPSQCALIAVGDVAPEALRRVVEEALGDWSPGLDLPREVRTPEAPLPGRRGVVIPASMRQPFVLYADRAPPVGHTDAPAFAVLTRILGGMFTATLNQALRETQGYTYGVHASYERTRDYGLFTLNASVAEPRIAQALAAFQQEVQRLRVSGPTEAELATARVLAVEARRAALEGDWSAAFAVARAFGAGRDMDTLWQDADRMAAVGAGDVQQAAQRWLRPAGAPLVVAGSERAGRGAFEQAGIRAYGVIPLGEALR